MDRGGDRERILPERLSGQRWTQRKHYDDVYDFSCVQCTLSVATGGGRCNPTQELCNKSDHRSFHGQRPRKTLIYKEAMIWFNSVVTVSVSLVCGRVGRYKVPLHNNLIQLIAKLQPPELPQSWINACDTVSTNSEQSDLHKLACFHWTEFTKDYRC